MRTPRSAPLALALIATALAPSESAQTTRDFNDSREAMWWAPTAEDWKRPCLIAWQRTWEDAVRLSRETGKPILACINMDGEIASEHYAGVRYRQPEIATIYEPYVTVIASVYRHTPRDYDEDGRRVPCPRFGGVTCGEHIQIEPLLFERYMDGRRIAPRHIMIELDGAETYDVYYAFDTASVFRQVREGVAGREVRPRTTDAAELTLVERVASPDSADREQVESEYVAADRATKRTLVRAAIEAGEKASVDLLRLAVFDLDTELNRLARLALSQATTENAIGLINESLRAPMSQEEREALIAALDRLGDTYPRARTLAAVHRGLAARSDTVDLQGWSEALGGALYPASTEAVASDDRLALEYSLENKSQASRTRPQDPQALLEFAEASLALAIDPEAAVSLASNSATGSRYATLMFEDVQRAAMRAEELGSDDWRVDALLALSAYYLEDAQEAHRRAEAAVAAMPSGEKSWNAMAVLALFAQAREQAIKDAVRQKVEWPKEWLTDVNAAYSVLARHPMGSDEQIAAHNDFLRWLGAFAQAERVLDAGLARFPDSAPLHARLRGRTLWTKGAGALEDVYGELLAQEDASPHLEWFAGYASLVVAEFHRRSANDEEALAAYDRGMAHFERAIDASPESRDSSDHYIAMALAGRARIAMEQKELERAVEELLASFERKPEAAATLDGLGLTAVATATTLRARLSESGNEELAARVQAALDALDPVLLDPPAFERQGPQGGTQRQDARRRDQQGR